MPREPTWVLIDSETGNVETFCSWKGMVKYAERHGMEIWRAKKRRTVYRTIKIDPVPPIHEWMVELEKRE
jgi:hypothetical protein